MLKEDIKSSRSNDELSAGLENCCSCAGISGGVYAGGKPTSASFGFDNPNHEDDAAADEDDDTAADEEEKETAEGADAV